MRNQFIAVALAMAASAQMAKHAAIQAFNFGYQPRDAEMAGGDIGIGRNKYSRHCVAHDKRAAKKTRNRARNKRRA